MMRAVLPHFRKPQSGVAVSIRSAGGIIGMSAISMCMTTKLALQGMQRACLRTRPAGRGGGGMRHNIREEAPREFARVILSIASVG